MKRYLETFFHEFTYPKEDCAILLSAYDVIVANAEAHALLSEILAMYEKSHMLDYEKDILKTRAAKISELTGLHPYTTELLVFICLTKELKRYYKKHGIDEKIYFDSVLDLKWKLEECKAVKGICGSFVASWFSGFFDLTRFALGRLQFEIIEFGHHYEKNGIMLKPKDKVINVHIPRTGTPLDKESCDLSYAMAKCFFAGKVHESMPFVCHSWLLYPEHRNILSPKSNIYRFMSEYEILESGTNSGYDLWRLFDTDERDSSRLPADSSLRRNYITFLKNGGRPGFGFGIKFS